MENKPYDISNPDVTRIANQLKPQEIHPREADISVDWNVGDVILDLYEVTGFLGEGGMGKVYRVRHRGWNVDLAVKIPKPEIFSRAGGVENFERECETWVNLGLSLHTVSCYYVRRLGGIPRLFAEYVEGGSLKDWIENKKLYEGGLEKALERMLDIAIQFAWGLHYAHEHGLIHQDVKPANVMMTLDGLAKVTDFGLAKARVRAGEVGIGGSHQTILVSSGGMTPAYCSPEQASGERLSHKTDIWSLGVSILEMFTGRVTWMAGQLAAEALEIHLHKGAEDESIPRMPESLVDLLRHCFQKDLADRVKDMLQIAAALQGIYEQITKRVYFRKQMEPLKLRADALNNKSVSLLDLGHEEKAERYWNEALKADPSHLASIFNLGYFQWSKGKIDPYKDYYLATLKPIEESYGSDPEYWYNLALVCAEIGLVNATKESAKKADSFVSKKEWTKDILELPSPLVGIFMGHTDSIFSVIISPNGRYVISGSRDKTIRLWKTEDGKCVRIFKGLSEVNSIAISRDSRYIVSGAADKTIRLWDISTNRCLNIFKGHTGSVLSVAISRDGRYIVSGGEDKTLRLWAIESGRPLRVFEGHTGWVESVCISPDSKYIISGGRDGTIRLWKIDDGRCLNIFKGHSGSVLSVAISRDGRYIVSGGEDKTLRLWAIESGKTLTVFEGHTGWVESVCISPDGKYAISGSWDKTARVWEIETGRCLRVFEGHTEGVKSVSISPDGLYIISGGGDYTLRRWELRKPNLFQYIISTPSSSEAITKREEKIDSFIYKASSLIKEDRYTQAYALLKEARKVPGYSMDLQILDLINICGNKSGIRCGLNSAVCLEVFEGHIKGVNSVSISPDNRYIISGGGDHTIRLWERETGRCKVFEGHTKGVTSVCTSSDSRYILSGSGDHTIRLWDVGTGRCIKVFKGHTGFVKSVAISPDDRHIFSGGWDKTVRIWDVKTGKCIKILKGHTGFVRSVAISPDGRYIVSGGWDKTVRVWEIKTGRSRVFESHTGWIEAVSISSDGRNAISGGEDKIIKLWDIETGRCIRVFEGLTKGITSVYITPDNRYILSGGGENTIKLWDVETGRCIRVFEGHAGAVLSIALSRDGRYMVSGSEDRTIRLWELDWDWEFPANELSYDKEELGPDAKSIDEARTKEPALNTKTLLKQENSKPNNGANTLPFIDKL